MFYTSKHQPALLVKACTHIRTLLAEQVVSQLTEGLVSEDTNRSGPMNRSFNLLLPSAPFSVISLSSGRVSSLMLTSSTSVSGMPSIFAGTSAYKLILSAHGIVCKVGRCFILPVSHLPLESPPWRCPSAPARLQPSQKSSQGFFGALQEWLRSPLLLLLTEASYRP